MTRERLQSNILFHTFLKKSVYIYWVYISKVIRILRYSRALNVFCCRNDSVLSGEDWTGRFCVRLLQILIENIHMKITGLNRIVQMHILKFTKKLLKNSPGTPLPPERIVLDDKMHKFRPNINTLSLDPDCENMSSQPAIFL